MSPPEHLPFTATAATDAIGVAAAVTRNTPLAVLNSAASVTNNPDPVNTVLNALGFFPDLAVPAALLGANIDLDTFEVQTTMKGMINAIPKEEGNPVNAHDQEVQIPDACEGLEGGSCDV